MTAGVDDDSVDEAVDGLVAAPREVDGDLPAAGNGAVGAGMRGIRPGVGPDPASDGDAAGSVTIGSGPGTAQGAAGRPRVPITVEEAYRAKLAAAAAVPPGPVAVAAPDLPDTPPAEVGPPSATTVASRPRRPGTGPVNPGLPAGARQLPAAPPPPLHLRARPRIEPEQGILGLSRRTRSRLGSRLFNLFFVCVFALILVQMVVALLTP